MAAPPPIDKELSDAENVVKAKKAVADAKLLQLQQQATAQAAARSLLKTLYISIYNKCIGKPCNTCGKGLADGFFLSIETYEAVCSTTCFGGTSKTSFIALKKDYSPLIPIVLSVPLTAGWTKAFKKGLGLT